MTTSWTEGPIIGFDLETTSADPFLAIPVSYALVQFDGRRMVHGQAELINPGVEIPDEAIAVHGITNERARAEGIDLATAVEFMAKVLREASERRTPIAGMNIAYDFTVLRTLGALIEPNPVLDLMILDKGVDRYRKGSRKLAAVSSHYGVRLGADAHDAASDVVASVRSILGLADRHPAVAAYNLAMLHDLQEAWHREQMRSLSQYFVGQGNDPVPDWQFSWPIFANVRTCRICRCTDARACAGGCWWVEADLCNQCRARVAPVA